MNLKERLVSVREPAEYLSLSVDQVLHFIAAHGKILAKVVDTHDLDNVVDEPAHLVPANHR